MISGLTKRTVVAELIKLVRLSLVTMSHFNPIDLTLFIRDNCNELSAVMKSSFGLVGKLYPNPERLFRISGWDTAH